MKCSTTELSKRKLLNSSSENESTADPIRLPLAGNGVGGGLFIFHDLSVQCRKQATLIYYPIIIIAGKCANIMHHMPFR